jgi:demethylmenaquinone methyltransferase/2-methoxy-6-polyprenyl-1,4-benzoquinol methylase
LRIDQLTAKAKSEPKKPLQLIFTAVPPRYDLINHVITWGMDGWWRLKAARECLSSAPRRVLDLGCGTGDLAIQMAKMADDIEVIGLDYSLPMLEIARKKARRLAREKKITFVYGDAAHLPFPDGYFDCADISFAFRNLTYRNPLAERYLVEVLRVLAPGGRFIIVETSQPKAKLIRSLFHLYMRSFVFGLGWLISGQRGAYHYLAHSASHFYTAEELKELLIRVGFGQVNYRRLFWGVSAIHVAVK